MQEMSGASPCKAVVFQSSTLSSPWLLCPPPQLQPLHTGIAKVKFSALLLASSQLSKQES